VTMAIPRFCTVLAVVLALGLQATGAFAIGTPDWAKPHLADPTPTGGYIAKKDRWVIVYGEVLYGVETGGGIRKHCRYIFESLAESPQSFWYEFNYDQGAEDLKDIALHVDRGLHWQRVNVKKQSVQASRESADKVVLTSVDEVEPHHRIVLEYVQVGRYDYLPWKKEFFVDAVPIATLRVLLAPGSPATLKMRAVLPVGDALPACLVKESDSAWKIRSVPGSSRIPGDYPNQPGWTALFPWIVVYNEPRGASDRAFVQRYQEGWDAARKVQESEALAAKARDLVQGATSDFDKALRIGDFVQHKVQYDDSNTNSVHAWVPLEAEETLRSMKGDCKGKTLFTQSLLKAVGIESLPVLLRADREWYSWGPEPATANLNHVILAVRLQGGDPPPSTLTEGPASGWVLFDPVVLTASFGEPLPGYEGLPAFLVGTGENPRFTIRTRVPSAERVTATVRYRLDTAGVVRGSVKLNGNGAVPLLSRLSQTFSEEDLQTSLVNAFPTSLNRVQILDKKIMRAGADGARQMGLDLGFQLPGAVQSLAASVLLENPFALAAYLDGLPNGYWPPTPAEPDERIEVAPPWDNKKNAHGIEEVLDVEATVELPAGYLWTPPSPRDERTPYLVCQTSWNEERPGVWRGTLHLERRRGAWPTSDRKARLKLEDGLFTELYKSMELKKS